MGPVVLRDELEYFREMRLLDLIRVNLQLSGLSPDGSCFRFRNEFFRETGKMVARVTSTGGWLDLVERQLAAPPERLAQVLRSLEASGDFQELESKVRKR